MYSAPRFRMGHSADVLNAQQRVGVTWSQRGHRGSSPAGSWHRRGVGGAALLSAPCGSSRRTAPVPWRTHNTSFERIHKQIRAVKTNISSYFMFRLLIWVWWYSMHTVSGISVRYLSFVHDTFLGKTGVC